MNARTIQRTVTVPVYTFEELAEPARDRVRECEREFMYMSDTVSEYMDEEVRWAILAALAPDAAPELDGTKWSWARHFGPGTTFRVLWSLSHCQGDGVAFDGTFSRLDAPALPWPVGAVAARCEHSGHYTHEYSFSVFILEDGDCYGSPAPDEFVTALRQACIVAARAGYAAESALTSDEYIDDAVRERGELYMENGAPAPEGVGA